PVARSSVPLGSARNRSRVQNAGTPTLGIGGPKAQPATVQSVRLPLSEYVMHMEPPSLQASPSQCAAKRLIAPSGSGPVGSTERPPPTVSAPHGTGASRSSPPSRTAPQAPSAVRLSMSKNSAPGGALPHGGGTVCGGHHVGREELVLVDVVVDVV